MSNKNREIKKNKARRAILKTIVAGGGAITAAKTPDLWVKPVVEGLILPSHGQTTNPNDPNNPFGNFARLNLLVDNQLPQADENLIADESISEELLEFFVPSARAGNVPGNCNVDICATFQNVSAAICVTGQLVGSDTLVADLNATPPVFMGPVNIAGINFLGGQFDGTGWQTFLTNTLNVTTEIVLSPTDKPPCIPK